MSRLELHIPEIREHVTQHRDDDACRKLWLAVMKRTLTDLRYLRRYTMELRKHQMEEIRDIQLYPPGIFVEGAWFEEICDHLTVDAEALRRRLDEYVESAA